MASSLQVKLTSSLDSKKKWAKQLLDQVIFRISHGINCGSLDPNLIVIDMDNCARLPADFVADPLILGSYPPYLPSMRPFIYDMFNGDRQRMTSRQEMEFEDLLDLLSRLTTLRQLMLLSHHPHLQSEDQSQVFILAACNNLKFIQQNPNHSDFSLRHFPRLSNCHEQVGQDMATDPLMRWQKAYTRLVRLLKKRRQVNIRRSLSTLDPEFLRMYDEGYGWTEQIPYIDHDPVDELYFFCNAVEHLQGYYPMPQRLRILATTGENLLRVSPTLPVEMFRFYWCYDGLAMGNIDLCSVMETIKHQRFQADAPVESLPVRIFKVGSMYCWCPREYLTDEDAARMKISNSNLNFYHPIELDV